MGNKATKQEEEVSHGDVVITTNGQVSPKDGEPLAKVSSKSTRHYIAATSPDVMVAHYLIRISPLLTVLPILYLVGIVSGLWGSLAALLSAIFFLIPGGLTFVALAEGEWEASRYYRRGVIDALNESSEYGVRDPERSSEYGGSAVKGEMVMKPKLRHSLSPMRFIKSRVIGQSHYYDPEEGIHEVVTAHNSAYGTKVTSEKYLTDLAVFNRALDRMESL